MKFFSFVGSFLCSLTKFVKNILSVSFVFLLGVFILTVIMPENMQNALEIFENLF
jgi:hypothetical protein